MRIKDFTVQIRKHPKRRGRPSKYEYAASKVMSEYAERPDVKKAMSDHLSDMILFGTSSVKMPEL